jgi:hypothetical protein
MDLCTLTFEQVVGFNDHGNESEGKSVVTLYKPDNKWSLWKRRPRSKDNITMAMKDLRCILDLFVSIYGQVARFCGRDNESEDLI